MADISTLFKFTDSDGIVRINNTETRTAVGNSMVDTVIDVTTSEVTYAIPADIGDARELIIQNNDAAATSFISWGFDPTSTTAHSMKVFGGGVNKVDLVETTGTIYLIADTATQEVHLVCREK